MNAEKRRKKLPWCSCHDTRALVRRPNTCHVVQIKTGGKKIVGVTRAAQRQRQSRPSVLFANLVQQQLDRSGFGSTRVPLVHLASLRWKTLPSCRRLLQPISFLSGGQQAAASRLKRKSIEEKDEWRRFRFSFIRGVRGF